MSIYQEDSFKPTYLYIKQHSVTGKFYFGKTYKNPEVYLGSGLHWVRHIKKHGKTYVVTLWYELFTNKDEIQEFAFSFSKEMNIVKSKQWANMKPENGLDGNVKGNKHSNKTRQLISNIRSGKPGHKHTMEHKLYMSDLYKGKVKDKEIGYKISNTKKSKRIFKFTSPENEIFYTFEYFIFCDNHMLSYDVLKRNHDTIIKPYTRYNLNGEQLLRRNNSTGWMFTRISIL